MSQSEAEDEEGSQIAEEEESEEEEDDYDNNYCECSNTALACKFESVAVDNGEEEEDAGGGDGLFLMFFLARQANQYHRGRCHGLIRALVAFLVDTLILQYLARVELPHSGRVRA